MSLIGKENAEGTTNQLQQQVVDGDNLEVNGSNINFNRLESGKYSVFQIFAENEAVNGTERIVGPGVPVGTVNLTFPVSFRTLSFASTNTNDTSAGTGARSILIFGLDNNLLAKTEILTLNGQTEVDTVNQYLRINQFFVFSAGSGNTNEGNIYCSDDTDTFVLGEPQNRLYNSMLAQDSISKAGMHTMASNQRASFGTIQISSDAGSTKSFKLKIKVTNVGLGNVVAVIEKFIIGQGLEILDLSNLVERLPGSDLFITTETLIGGTVDVNVKLSLISQNI